MSTELAKAYVQIIPSAQGIKANLAKELGAEADNAGKESGGKFAESFKSSLGTLVKTTGSLIAGVGTMSAALVQATNDAATHGDEIDKMSQKLGLSASAYQEWDYVLGQAGVDITSMSTGLKTLTNKLDDAKNGGENAQKMFETLGISLEDLSNMSREEVFEAAIAGFQAMEDSTERAALANDLFGKSGQELTPLFNESAEATEGLRKAAHDLGFVMSDEAVQASADYKDALDTLQRTFDGLKTNMMTELMPSMTQVMDGLTQIFGGDKETGLAMISEGVSGLAQKITDALPTVIEAGGAIVLALVTAIMENMEQIISAAASVLMSFVTGLIEHLPMLIEQGMQIIASLITGIAQSLPTLIPQVVKVAIQIVQTLINNLPLILNAALQLVKGLAQGINDAIPVLIDALPSVILGIVTFLLDAIPEIIETGIELLTSLVEALPTIIQKIVEVLPEIITGIINALLNAIPLIIEAGIQLLISLIQALPQIITTIVKSIPQIITGIINALLNAIPLIIKSGIDLFISLIKDLPTIIVEIVKAVPQIIKGIVSAFNDLIGNIVEVGGNLIRGLWQGISNAADWLWEKISGWASSLLSGIKGLFGISSPSKVTTEFGKFLALGLGKGFGDNIGGVSDQIENQLSELTSKSARITAEVSATTTGYFGDSSQNRSGVVDLLRTMQETLQDIVRAEKEGHVIVLNDGTLIGVVDRKLGMTAARKARGN